MSSSKWTTSVELAVIRRLSVRGGKGSKNDSSSRTVAFKSEKTAKDQFVGVSNFRQLLKNRPVYMRCSCPDSVDTSRNMEYQICVISCFLP
ncbi:hypothetical protein JTE90_011860 [Oedothorax gibbosus]|uniref:Uncharacterized protein n=1 Tax=Oedothorax gibbosus TaxID=931172 RepID=A0AAV6V677_9ARAC|nr:hypothetical protein JTE90_011860 [Oedothorax gibbosus]